MEHPMLTLARAAVAALAAYLFIAAPPYILLGAPHRIVSVLDPLFSLAVVQACLLAILAAAQKGPLCSLARARPSESGVRAAGWFLLGDVLIALLFAVTVVSTSSASSVGFTVSNGLESLGRDFHKSGIAGGLVRVGVIAPVLEEFLFRVLILGCLLRTARPWIALGISTALFAAVHDGWLVPAFLGLVLGLLYLRYRSLWLCVVTHSVHNLLVAVGAPLLVAYLHEATLLRPIMGNLLLLQVCWLGVGLGCFGLFLHLVLRGGGSGEKMSPLQAPPPTRAAVGP
jgi:membrane protease YdiL (CAAX protease family)